MPKTQTIKIDKIFQGFSAVSDITGFSQGYLRQGCKDDTIPHVRVGVKYLINVPAYLDKLGVPYEAIRL